MNVPGHFTTKSWTVIVNYDIKQYLKKHKLLNALATRHLRFLCCQAAKFQRSPDPTRVAVCRLRSNSQPLPWEHHESHVSCVSPELMLHSCPCQAATSAQRAKRLASSSSSWEELAVCCSNIGSMFCILRSISASHQVDQVIFFFVQAISLKKRGANPRASYNL